MEREASAAGVTGFGGEGPTDQAAAQPSTFDATLVPEYDPTREIHSFEIQARGVMKNNHSPGVESTKRVRASV